MSDTLLIKIKNLLAKAESSEYEAERIAFNAKATQLMQNNAIDKAQLIASGQTASEEIGALSVTINGYAKAKLQLLLQIADAFGAKVITDPNSRQTGWATINTTVIGWDSDLAGIEILFSSLLMQVTNDAEKAASVSREHGRAFKQAFILGFALKVGDRLRAQRASAVSQAEDTRPGTGLAVIDRSRAVERDYRRRYPSTGKGTAAKASSANGYRNGAVAGERADIGQAKLSAKGRAAIG